MRDRHGIAEIVDAMAEIGAPFSLTFMTNSGTLSVYAGGVWPSGRPVHENDLFYAASLAKQVTGAAIAVLVKRGLLQLDKPVADYVVGSGAWAEKVSIRRLLHHTSGLPLQGALEADLGAGHWTNASVMEWLRGLDGDAISPGTSYGYSNAGYVVLARIVEAVCGLDFAHFAKQTLFDPLGIQAMHFSEVPGWPGSEQWELLGPNLPLSTGDGGLWTTARSFGQWLACQNRDELAIADLVTRPGALSDGSTIDYGWGLGLRGSARSPLLVHGGNWPGAAAKAIRHPETGLALVVLGAAAISPLIVDYANRIHACLLQEG